MSRAGAVAKRRESAARRARAAGELEYILPKYCSPRPRSSPLWPSEERLRAADVHVAGLPQASMTELVTLLRNRTLLLMGDSVMEQFYSALQCFLRKEELEIPPDDSFLSFIKRSTFIAGSTIALAKLSSGGFMDNGLVLMVTRLPTLASTESQIRRLCSSTRSVSCSA